MKSGNLLVKYFDVGLGDCIVAISNNETLLIDGGIRYFDSLKKFFKEHDVSYINHVICTHAHEDHVDGLADVLSQMNFGDIYCNIKEFPKSKSFTLIKSIVENNGKEIIIPEIGEEFRFGACKVVFLSPGNHSELVTGNDRSLTCMIECYGKKLLMSGDVGEKVFDMWRKENICVKANVFKIPHHGQKPIQSENLQMVSPDYAVISYGVNNFGPLSEDLFYSLNSMDCSVLSTYDGGDIECVIDDHSNISVYYSADKKLSGKKILILGANEETKKYVNRAHQMGIKTIVTDHIPNSPAKSVSDDFYNINGNDVIELKRKFLEDNINGLVLGVADPLTSAYMKLANELHVPCFLSNNNIDFFINKVIFKKICKEYGFSVVDEFYVGNSINEALKKNIEYPCVIKPSVGRGGKGVFLCKSEKDLIEKFEISLSYSDDGLVSVEKYMDCSEIVANYLFIDGNAYLIAVSDRRTVKCKNSISPVTYANEYPSILTNVFIEKCDQKFKRVFSSLEICNGILEMQIFWDGRNFYPYDPTCVVGGELSSPVFSKFYCLDLIGAFIRFSLTGHMGIEKSRLEYLKHIQRKFAQSIWILLKPGKIAEIYGIEEVMNLRGMLGHVQRLHIGDCVKEEMFETEKSAIARFWVEANSKESLENLEKKIRSSISVIDINGNDMIWNGEGVDI